MLCHDEITIPSATAAMAIAATENKGDGGAVRDRYGLAWGCPTCSLGGEIGKRVKIQNHKGTTSPKC